MQVNAAIPGGIGDFTSYHGESSYSHVGDVGRSLGLDGPGVSFIHGGRLVGRIGELSVASADTRQANRADRRRPDSMTSPVDADCRRTPSSEYSAGASEAAVATVWGSILPSKPAKYRL